MGLSSSQLLVLFFFHHNVLYGIFHKLSMNNEHKQGLKYN